MSTVVSTLTCTFCGSDSPRTARFCSNCGRDLSGVEYAGFWIRVGAFLIDLIILFIALLVLYFLVGPVGTFVWYLVVIAYNVGFWSARGATPGKMFVGIEIISEDSDSEGIGFGRAALRQIGYVASNVTFGVGFLMIAFNREKRGLHDYIASTKVVRS